MKIVRSVVGDIQRVPIQEFAEKHDLTLEIEYNHRHSVWTACFADTEIKDSEHSPILASPWGRSNVSDYDAVLDYIGEIRGMWMVVNSTNKETRKEFQVPGELYLDGDLPE